MSILIIDDEEFNREILTDILEDEGYEVLTAENGKLGFDVLEQSEEGSVKLIMLDRMMPVMNGMEFIDKIQLIDKWKDIPIIFQTAANQPKDLVEGMAKGAFYYLTKPFDKKVVLSIISSALVDE